MNPSGVGWIVTGGGMKTRTRDVERIQRVGGFDGIERARAERQETR